LAPVLRNRKQALATAPSATPSNGSSNGADELACPVNLPDDYQGYWMEAAGKLKTADAAAADKLKGVLGALRAAANAGDASKIESAGLAVRDLLFDL
jgi:hypothetical protein